jgi:hypothetical protein
MSARVVNPRTVRAERPPLLPALIPPPARSPAPTVLIDLEAIEWSWPTWAVRRRPFDFEIDDV